MQLICFPCGVEDREPALESKELIGPLMDGVALKKLTNIPGPNSSFLWMGAALNIQN